MKTLLVTIVLFLLCAIDSNCSDFETYFENKTLRIDYIFSGNYTASDVSLRQTYKIPNWAGRRGNLAKLQLKGNGQIKMTDQASGKCIYIDSFSTLFNEWQTIDESKKTKNAFENTFLLPFPKTKVFVEISLRTKAGTYKPMIKHVIDPNDILIKELDNSRKAKYTTIHQGGDISKSINVAFVAEGYRANEMEEFRKHAQIAFRQIMKHKAFGDNREQFNFIVVETVSEDSGVSIPRKNIWKKTAFGSHFDTFYAERYLTTRNVSSIHDVLAGIPYSHIIILANTDIYGGGGIYNAFTLTTTEHEDFKPVIVHEFGHSFAGLADEYFYETDVFNNTYPLKVEPWEPNITTLVNFASKWKKLLAPSTPIPTPLSKIDDYKAGVFEGAGYSAKGIYRSAKDCRMKTNTATDFCPACESSIRKLIEYYTEE